MATGTGYIPLARYLERNRDQYARLAEQLAQPLEQQAAGVQSDLSKARSAFAEGLQQGQVTFNSESSEEEALGMASKRYSGPKDLGDVGALQQRALDAERGVGNLQSFGGLSAALQGRGGPMYGLGSQRLDAALLGQAGGDRFADLRQRFSGLFSGINEAQTTAREQARAAEDSSEEAARKYGTQAAMLAEQRRLKEMQANTYDMPEPRGPQYKRDQLDRRRARGPYAGIFAP